jgi:uncharacterized C2H2 Zn-finger protein
MASKFAKLCCPICNKVFDNIKELRKHENTKTHTKKELENRKRISKPKKNFKDVLLTHIIEKEGTNIHTYFNKIYSHVERILDNYTSIKFKFNINCFFTHPKNYSDILVYFNSGYFRLNSMNNFDYKFKTIEQKFIAWVDNFQQKGSGYIFDRIKLTELTVVKVKSLTGSSYFKLPFINNNILNIQNKDDKCFLWCIIATILEIKSHPERVSHYKNYEGYINMGKIEYPVKIEDIPKFENMNDNVSINVFALKDQKNVKSLYPLYVSNYSDREVIIDLLYVENENSLLFN